jgi:Polyketide cyclase / dehydrase and lipid transport
MKWLLIALGVMLCCILIVLIIGYLLPVKHTASMRVSVNASPDIVWERLTGFKDFPQWRKDVKAVEVISDMEWVEIDQHNGKLPLRIINEEPGRLLVTQIMGHGLPFGGTWEFRLEPDGKETVVTITENGEVYNPIFRFVSRFIVGHVATIKRYSGFLIESFK